MNYMSMNTLIIAFNVTLIIAAGIGNHPAVLVYAALSGITLIVKATIEEWKDFVGAKDQEYAKISSSN